jgi:hypothetical protein
MNIMHHANLLIMCKNNSRSWLLFANLFSISGWLESVKSWNQKPAKSWNRESAKFGNQVKS